MKIVGILAQMLVLSFASCALSGCYQHVVRAEGVPPGQYEIHEPNLEGESSSHSPRVHTERVPSKKADG